MFKFANVRMKNAIFINILDPGIVATLKFTVVCCDIENPYLESLTKI